MCDEVCECCEKDVCKCTKQIPTKLNELIAYSIDHPIDENNRFLDYKGWEIFTNTKNTFIRKLFKENRHILIPKLDYNEFTIFNSRWINTDDQLNPTKYYIENFEINEYGIYIKIGVK